MLDALLVGGLGAGVGTVLHGATAFTGGTVPRNSTVNVAPDGSAILGLSIADSVVPGRRTWLADLTNNGTEPYTLEVSLDDPSQGTLYVPTDSGDSVTTTLDPGATGTLEIETDEPTGTTIPFTISRSAPEFSFSIDRATTVGDGFDGPVDLDLSGAVSTSGKNGKFAFTLENTGTVDVRLHRIGIVETTNPRADYVTGNGSLVGGNTEYVIDPIQVDSSTPGATLETMSPKPRLDHQSDGDGVPMSRDLQFDKFRSNSAPKRIDMRGHDVKIELEVENLRDGTHTTGTVNLCDGSCGF